MEKDLIVPLCPLCSAELTWLSFNGFFFPSLSFYWLPLLCDLFLLLYKSLNLHTFKPCKVQLSLPCHNWRSAGKIWLFSISVTVYLDFENVFMSALSVKTWELCEFSLLLRYVHHTVHQYTASVIREPVSHLLFLLCVCSRLTKTDMELEVLRYTNRISSEAHKMVRSFRASTSTPKMVYVKLLTQ